MQLRKKLKILISKDKRTSKRSKLETYAKKIKIVKTTKEKRTVRMTKKSKAKKYGFNDWNARLGLMNLALVSNCVTFVTISYQINMNLFVRLLLQT